MARHYYAFNKRIVRIIFIQMVTRLCRVLPGKPVPTAKKRYGSEVLRFGGASLCVLVAALL
jgi:hypothetical protein